MKFEESKSCLKGIGERGAPELGVGRINKHNLLNTDSENTDDRLPKSKTSYLTIKITALDAVLAIAKATSSIQILPVYFPLIA
ncbi:MAG: hypothetical protein GPJ13_14955 [Microcystis aeruginosa W11-06]|nr:hypothetical protein [Microcystis aeruginosa W11-06]TRV04775.1 MAG: hypothetical protein EWV73_02075 [Microcystis wesenbergii Mw_QC_B_20070930_S4D]